MHVLGRARVANFLGLANFPAKYVRELTLGGRRRFWCRSSQKGG